MKASVIKQSHLHTVSVKVNEHTVIQPDDPIELFPQPRYFQIHFQNIHDNTDALRKELNQLKRHTANVEAKLDMLLSLLDGSSKPLC